MEWQTWRENPSCTVHDSNPTFVSLSKLCMSLHVRNPRMNTRILWCLQQDFDLLILECFESGINVSINTVCAWCRDTTYYEMDNRCEWKANQHIYLTTPVPLAHAPTAATWCCCRTMCARPPAAVRWRCSHAGGRALTLLACPCSPPPLLHRCPPARRRISCAA